MVLEREDDRVIGGDESAVANGLDHVLKVRRKTRDRLLTAFFRFRIWKGGGDVNIDDAAAYLEENFGAHGLAVSDDGLFVTAFAIPAVQLDASI